MQERLSEIERLVQEGIDLAVDTEFEEGATLCVQFATRDARGRLCSQIYHSPEIPPPQEFDGAEYLRDLRTRVQQFEFRTPKVLSARLSPAQALIDILELEDVTPLSRQEGHARLKDPQLRPANAVWDEKKQRCTVPAIRVRLIGHYLPADLPRCFGRRHHRAVFKTLPDAPAIELSGHKRLSLVSSGCKFANGAPVVEFLQTAEGYVFAIRLETIDTTLPFGPGNLESLCQAFLGVGKTTGFTADELEGMRETFLRQPDAAFGYALRDAVLTLLLFEEFVERDRAMYASFGIPAELAGPMKPTLGSRVSNFLVAATRQSARESKYIGNGVAIKRLMRQGGIQRFGSGNEGSHFGAQTGAVRGGLQFSRTPTEFWHAAPSMLRDIDLKSCYPQIASGINVYWGRPVLWEPGSARMSLQDAVDYVRDHADPDAWFIRVSGDIAGFDNVLVPSTVNAITPANIRRRNRRALSASGSNGTGGDSAEKFCGKLFTRRIESGVITAMTWAMIQGLPERVRREYGSLTVDGIVFYPRRLVAETPEQYDELYNQLRRDGLWWKQELDLDQLQRTETLQFDHEDVSLKFPLNNLVGRLVELRQEARRVQGQGSGAELSWKLTTNSMYGVLGSRLLATGNCVAANVITAHARAVAFAMFLALNGLQLVTDGCVYRRDRLPKSTFKECLEHMPRYCLLHADQEAGIEFYDPSEIPQDEGKFNVWLRGHIERFFGFDQATAKQLMVHQVEHKRTPETGKASFDALACDGGANYLKLTGSKGQWKIREMKTRSYGSQSKDVLGPWILKTYPTDRLEEPAPITVDRNLLKLEPAIDAARRIFKDHRAVKQLTLPLGCEYESVKAYKVLKISAFLFQTPKQEATFRRQLEGVVHRTGYGLDLVALRRPYKGHLRNSPAAAAKKIFEYVQSGGRDVVKTFNLRKERLSTGASRQVERRRDERQKRRREADQRLAEAISVSNKLAEKPLTGIVISRRNVARPHSIAR